MYHYVSSLCLDRELNSKWEIRDISDMSVNDIYSTYLKTYLKLSHPALEDDVFVDVDDLKIIYPEYPGTLTELLEENGDQTIPTTNVLPIDEVVYANYADAVYSEYKLDVVKAGEHHPEGYKSDYLTDISITKPTVTNFDLKQLHDYCMISVNGYFHRTDGFNENNTSGCYVYDGGTTLRINKWQHNHVGILSFVNIGKINKVQIKEEAIHRLDDDSPLSNRLCFSIEEDITNKSVILVLGGYLVFPEKGVFWQHSDKGFILNIQKIPYIERLIESSYFIDLSHLGLTESETAKDLYNTEEVYSDEVLTKYMTLSQTFLAIIDVPHLVTKKHHIKHNNLPGEYTSYTEPTNLMLVGYGKAAEYWKKEEDGQWSVMIEEGWIRNFISLRQRLEINNSHLIPSNLYHYNRGLFLEIAGYWTK